jgi:chromosome partitioning protein
MSKEPYVIAIANQKGGVAKTTTVVSLGGGLVNHDKEVLLVDLDAQANLTLALGKDPARVRGTVSQLFFNAASLLSLSRDTSIAGLDLVPSNSEMDAAERFLPLRKNYEMILYQAIFGSTPSGATEINGSSAARPEVLNSEVGFKSNGESKTPGTAKAIEKMPEIGSRSQPYDFILLDCPPIIGAVTLNAIAAAHMLIVPAQPEYFSAHALRTMMTTIQQIRNQNNPDLVYRILITMLDRRNRIHRDVTQQIRDSFGVGVFETMIEVDTKLRESAVEGLPITHHPAAYHSRPPRSALQYNALAQELIAYVEAHG